MSRIFHGILPFLVFPAFTVLGAKYIWATILETEYQNAFTSYCEHSPPSDFALEYIGIEVVDHELCKLVAFFHDGLQPIGFSFTVHLLFNLAPIPVFALIEASRSGRPWALSTPVATIIGLAYQLYSAGVILPIYWTIFVVSGAARRPGKVTQAHAQAVFFAFLLAYFLPSTAMAFYVEPWTTALWQPFPFWLFIAYHFHLLVRPASAHPTSGRRIIQGLYALIFFIAALSHLTIVWPNRANWPALRDAFVPFFITPGQVLVEDVAAKNFLQWDGAFIFAGALLATLWFARDVGEALVLVVWNVTASLTIGPGAALAAVYAWREEWVNPS